MRWVIGCLLVAACGHAPPPKVEGTEEPVTGPETLIGTWLTNDELDWLYRLTILPDGRFVMKVERSKMGSCEQRGTIAHYGEGASFLLTLTRDTCSKSEGGSLPFTIPSFTGNAMTLAYKVGTAKTKRFYTRDPKFPRQTVTSPNTP